MITFNVMKTITGQMDSLKDSFIFSYEVIRNCHYPECHTNIKHQLQ